MSWMLRRSKITLLLTRNRNFTIRRQPIWTYNFEVKFYTKITAQCIHARANLDLQHVSNSEGKKSVGYESSPEGQNLIWAYSIGASPRYHTELLSVEFLNRWDCLEANVAPKG